MPGIMSEGSAPVVVTMCVERPEIQSGRRAVWDRPPSPKEIPTRHETRFRKRPADFGVPEAPIREAA